MCEVLEPSTGLELVSRSLVDCILTISASQARLILSECYGGFKQ